MELGGAFDLDLGYRLSPNPGTAPARSQRSSTRGYGSQESSGQVYYYYYNYYFTDTALWGFVTDRRVRHVSAGKAMLGCITMIACTFYRFNTIFILYNSVL